eukprot:TRINITY_DN13385_c0_g3_i1.p1 TRINITY_DN13385_c0_g3~~TRINITY_DN13385_c0_g3_i1.p1  ORF type:complete len:1642 (-),score=261.41 TRINITY_DN13385_c0_g3_i1:104-5029(-)
MSEALDFGPGGFDTYLKDALWSLYGASDEAEFHATVAVIRQSQPKAGACPVQWSRNNIGFRCLDCEFDTSCVQCVECFFKSNHLGHDVKMFRSSGGGTCDCGDPASWDPAGFCSDHSQLQPNLDGPKSLDLLPASVRGKAHEIIPALIHDVDVNLSVSNKVVKGSFGVDASISSASEDVGQSKRYERAARLLVELKNLGEVAFGLRYIVCEHLTEARLVAWITWRGPGVLKIVSHEEAEKEENETRDVRRALHDLMLLYAQVSPSFKLRLARVFSDCYERIFPSERNEVVGDIIFLGVQLLTISEVAVDLVTQRGLLERFSNVHLNLLKPFVTEGKMKFTSLESSVSDAHGRLRLLYFDLGYVLGQSRVCSYVLSTPSAMAALLHPIQLMWRMNAQARCTTAHIIHEEIHQERFAFSLEGFMLQHMGSLGDYCRRPETTLEEVLCWYQAIAESLTRCHEFHESFNSDTEASFHLPLIRLLARCMNFDLLADPECAMEIAAALSPSCIATILRHVVVALRFSVEIRDGRWVLNGDVMRVQEDKYQRQFRQLDVLALQMCVVLVGQQRISSASLAATPSANVLEQLWCSVFDGTIGQMDGTTLQRTPTPEPSSGTSVADVIERLSGHQLESPVLTRWLQLLGQYSSDGQAVHKIVRSYVELFWNLLMRVVNDFLPAEVAMCSGKWKGTCAERVRLILQRCLAQVLARGPLALSELQSVVPPDLCAREAQIMDALENVATRQENQFVASARSWRLYDAFLAPVGSLRDYRDQRGGEEAARAEEAGLAQKDATLLGPRRADKVAMAPRLQDRILDSFNDSPLVKMILAFIQHQRFIKTLSTGNAPSRPAAEVHLDNAFVCCLKILDVVCDVPSLENSSGLASQFCQPPYHVRLLSGGRDCGQRGLVGETTRRDVGDGASLEFRKSMDCSGSDREHTDTSSHTVPESGYRSPPSCHSAIVEELAVLDKLGSEHVLIARLLSPRMLPHRLGDSGRALGLQGGERSVVDVIAGPSVNDAAMRKRQRTEAMKQRQQAMLLRMQQQQRAVAAELGEEALAETNPELAEAVALGDENPEDDVEAWQCATCREAGRPSDPLARVAEVGPSNGASFTSCVGGVGARFTSCGHLVHVGCCKTHLKSVQRQATDGSVFFFVDPRRGEFPCPMCRSLANCALPCMPIADVLEQAVTETSDGDPGPVQGTRGFSFTWLPLDALARPAKWRARAPSQQLFDSLAATAAEALRATSVAARRSGEISQEEDGASNESAEVCSARMLRAAVADLNVASVLSALQLADCGAIPPLYATLFRCALCLKRAELDAHGSSQRPVADSVALLQQFLQRDDLGAIDLRYALAELFVTSLCSHGGISQEGYTELVVSLLYVRAKQIDLPDCSEAASDAMSEREMAPRLVAFLVFASWLGAAVWRLPPVDGQRLAYLDPTDPAALASVTSLLRLPASIPTSDNVLALARQAVPNLQRLSDAKLCDFDWLLPGRSALTNMISLPEDFLDLIKLVYRRPCDVCGAEPAEPALCLFCGTLVCVDSHDCRGSHPSEGQCTEHARRCGAGQCVFILPYRAIVLAVSAPLCGFWDCPYVDHNGEPNPRLLRPCLMNFKLDERRLATLRRVCATSSIHREIIQHNERTGLHIPRPL